MTQEISIKYNTPKMPDAFAVKFRDQMCPDEVLNFIKKCKQAVNLRYSFQEDGAVNAIHLKVNSDIWVVLYPGNWLVFDMDTDSFKAWSWTEIDQHDWKGV